MPSQVFPFVGVNQSIASRMAPSGTLRRAENCEVLQDGSLRVRPGFSALPLTTYGLDSASSFTPYDLAVYRENLVALGDSLGYGYPTDVFSKLDGVANAWRPTAAELNEVPRLGSLTRARNIGDAVDQEGSVAAFGIAVSGRFLAMVWQTGSGISALSYIHVVDTQTDQTVMLRRLLDDFVIAPQVEAVPGEEAFIVVGVSNFDNSEVFAGKFTPLTDETPTVPQQILAAAFDLERVVVCPGASGEVVVAASGAGTTILACRTDGTTAGTTALSSVTSAISSSRLSICASPGSDWIVMAHLETTVARLNGWTYSSGAANHYSNLLATGTANEFVQVAVWTVGAEADMAVTDLASGSGLNINRRAQLVPLSGTVSTFQFLQNFRMLAAPPHCDSRSDLQYLGAGYGAEGANGSEVLIAYHLDPDDMAPECAIGDSTEQIDPPPRIARTSTELFWPRLPQNEDGFGAPQVTAFLRGSTARRQCVEFAGSLYITGALPAIYGGRSLVEQGFTVVPEPLEVAGTTSGVMTELGTYRYRMYWEWIDEGRRTHRSAVSPISEVTLLAGQRSVTILARVPLSLRTSNGSEMLGSALRCVVFRTSVFADPANTSLLLTGETFHKTAVAYVPTTQAPGTTVNIQDNRADESDPIDLEEDLIAQATLYVQTDALGDDKAPGPAEYAAVSRDRMGHAGLTDPEEWRVSKRLPNRAPVRWADVDLLALKGRITGAIVAIRQLGDVILLFSVREIWAVSGVGPDDSGQGEYFPPTRIPTAGGMDPDGWQSMAETEEGLFFKLGNGKLYLLDRSLQLTWVGHPVVDILEEFPVVTSAVHTPADQAVSWGLQSADGLSGGILRRDLRSKQWFFDPIGPVGAMVQHQGRRTILMSGSVMQQDASSGGSTPPVVVLETNNFQFAQSMGWGMLLNLGVLGTYRGPCRLKLEVDYQDGHGFEDSAEWVVSESEHDEGDKVLRQFQPCQQDQDAFRLRVTMTPDANSRGVELHAVAVEHDLAPNLSRRGDNQRR